MFRNLLFQVPKDPPRNVVINSKTSTSFTLSWDPPLEPNGAIMGYDIWYYKCGKPNEKTLHDKAMDSVHTITDLQPWRCYRIQVACQSSGGLGPYSDYVENKTDPAGKKNLS